MIIAKKPKSDEYAAFYETYLAYMNDEDILVALQEQNHIILTLAGLDKEQAQFRYAEAKWTVVEVLGHMLDVERVFGYRALCIARGEKANLPAMSEQDYAIASQHHACSPALLIEEFMHLRKSHVLMFKHLPDEAWSREGSANGHSITVRALAFIMVGHVRHHLRALTVDYGLSIG